MLDDSEGFSDSLGMLANLDELFDQQQAQQQKPKLLANLPRPEAFWFEPDEEYEGEWLVWFKCGTWWGSKLLADPGKSGVSPVTIEVPLTGVDAVKPITRPSDGHVVAYPVSHVDVRNFSSIINVTRTAIGSTFGAQHLSFGGDYELDNGTLVLLQQLTPNQQVIVTGTAWSVGVDMEGAKPQSFPFPVKPTQMGTKPICNYCPKQFSCLAGRPEKFGISEFKVLQQALGADPFKHL